MDTARATAAWDHTANILAMTAEINRDPKRRPRPYTIHDFHPHRPRRTETNPALGWELFRGLIKSKKRKSPPSPSAAGR